MKSKFPRCWTYLPTVALVGLTLLQAGCWNAPARRPAAAATRSPGSPPPHSPLPAADFLHDSAFFNVMVPAGWQVADLRGGRSLRLVAESGTPAWTIEIAFLDEEIGLQNTLEAWYPAYRRKIGAPIAEMEVVKSTQRYDSAGDNTRMLVARVTSASGPETMALRTNFNLVLAIGAHSGDAATQEMVGALAESLGFHNDAPRNLLHLHQRAGAEREPVNLSSLTLQRWGYMESWPRYEVSIPLWEWWYGGDAVLHRTIPDCSIGFATYLGHYGGEGAPDTRYERILAFDYLPLGAERGAQVSFNFVASVDAAATTGDAAECRRAVDALLDTVRLAPSGLEP